MNLYGPVHLPKLSAYERALAYQVSNLKWAASNQYVFTFMTGIAFLIIWMTITLASRGSTPSHQSAWKFITLMSSIPVIPAWIAWALVFGPRHRKIRNQADQRMTDPQWREVRRKLQMTNEVLAHLREESTLADRVL